MSKKVIILTFELESLPYQAFSEIKRIHSKKELTVEQMAVVYHSGTGDHQFEMKDFLDFTGKNHTAKNSTIGMFLGILGGPLGMMFGWFAGSVLGGAQDAKELSQAASIFEFVGKELPEGQTGLLLLADEKDNRPLNQLVFNQLGGQITRFDVEDVEGEIAKAQTLEAEVEEKKTKP